MLPEPVAESRLGFLGSHKIGREFEKAVTGSVEEKIKDEENTSVALYKIVMVVASKEYFGWQDHQENLPVWSARGGPVVELKGVLSAAGRNLVHS